MSSSRRLVMIGATGAVGGQVLARLSQRADVDTVTVLGRRVVAGLTTPVARQHVVDVFDPASYAAHLAGHDTAICTLGVGEPTKVSREDFVRTDKTAVLDFAAACRAAGVQHFLLLCSVGADPASRSFYLRVKGELEAGLEALGFARLSLFEPSMILTPANRYGLSQAVLLAVWPVLTPLLAGPLRKYRGIEVARLGAAMAEQAFTPGTGTTRLTWDDIVRLAPR